MESEFLSELLGPDRRGLNLHCVSLWDGGNLSLIELPWEWGFGKPGFRYWLCPTWGLTLLRGHAWTSSLPPAAEESQVAGEGVRSVVDQGGPAFESGVHGDSCAPL